MWNLSKVRAGGGRLTKKSTWRRHCWRGWYIWFLLWLNDDYCIHRDLRYMTTTTPWLMAWPFLIGYLMTWTREIWRGEFLKWKLWLKCDYSEAVTDDVVDFGWLESSLRELREWRGESYGSLVWQDYDDTFAVTADIWLRRSRDWWRGWLWVVETPRDLTWRLVVSHKSTGIWRYHMHECRRVRL